MDKLEKDDIKFIDLQFTGLFGKFHHITISANMFKKTDFENGLPKVDGSSIHGFTEIHESDLIVRPDPSTYAIIPWIDKYKTCRLICDILRGGSNRIQFLRDPRGIAKKAEKYVNENGYAISYWGPEVEFFVFDKLLVNTLTPFRSQSYEIISKESPWASDGSGYTLNLKEGYLPSAPGDSLIDFRNECVDILSNNFGIACDAHHHEVATDWTV